MVPRIGHPGHPGVDPQEVVQEPGARGQPDHGDRALEILFFRQGGAGKLQIQVYVLYLPDQAEIEIGRDEVRQQDVDLHLRVEHFDVEAGNDVVVDREDLAVVLDVPGECRAPVVADLGITDPKVHSSEPEERLAREEILVVHPEVVLQIELRFGHAAGDGLCGRGQIREPVRSPDARPDARQGLRR